MAHETHVWTRLLAAIVNLKSVLADELLNRASIGDGNEACNLLSLQNKAIREPGVVRRGPEGAGVDWLLYLESFGHGRAQFTEHPAHAP